MRRVRSITASAQARPGVNDCLAQSASCGAERTKGESSTNSRAAIASGEGVVANSSRMASQGVEPHSCHGSGGVTATLLVAVTTRRSCPPRRRNSRPGCRSSRSRWRRRRAGGRRRARGQQSLPGEFPGHEVDLVVADGHRLRVGVGRRVSHVVADWLDGRAVLVWHGRDCLMGAASMPARQAAAAAWPAQRYRARRRPTRHRAGGDKQGRGRRSRLPRRRTACRAGCNSGCS